MGSRGDKSERWEGGMDCGWIQGGKLKKKGRGQEVEEKGLN